MIWMSWKLHRVEAMIGGLLSAGFAIALLITGLQMSHAASDFGLRGCEIGAGQVRDDPSCYQALQTFTDRFWWRNNVYVLFQAVPLFFGRFLALPILQEKESGTFRLAWLQTIPRKHWEVVRVAVLATVAVLLALLWVSMVAIWRYESVRTLFNGNRFEANRFDFTAPMIIAYTLFAFSLTIAVGSLLRRTVAVISIAVVAFIASRVLIEIKLRPRFLAPRFRRLTASVSDDSVRHNWSVGQGWVNSAGHRFSDAWFYQQCQPSGLEPANFFDSCTTRLEVERLELFQPGARYWPFQGIEVAIFLLLSAGLLAFSFWWTQRRSA